MRRQSKVAAALCLALTAPLAITHTATAQATTCTPGARCESENATYSGAVYEDLPRGQSGSGYLNFNTGAGNYVEWPVEVTAGGYYDLTFGYALLSGMAPRPVSLTVNGQQLSSSVFPETGSWSTWSTLKFQAALNAGANTVRVTTASSDGPNLDWLSVAPSPAGTGTAVTPISMASFTTAHPTDSDSVRFRGILRNTNRYALTTWYDTVKNFDAQTGTYLTFGGTAENHIRPSAAQAFGLAVSLKLGVYQTSSNDNPNPTTAVAKARTIKLISSLAYQHRVNTTGGWGNAWQSAHWAGFAGFAGWLMWDDLSVADREYVRKMVEHEANRFTGFTVPYYRSEAGTFLTPGDTKAEENAWNAQLLHVATAMMPRHPNHATWMRKNLELMISANARPQDVTRTTVVNGRTLSDWLNGSNINSDGTIVNHNRIHPDYADSVALSTHAGLAYSMTRTPTPRGALFNADVVYDSIVDQEHVVGTNPYSADPKMTYTAAAPGGTVYKYGTGDIYYPHPNDWGTGRRMHFAAMDVMADAFGFDALASQKGAYWSPFHALKVLDMQNRHTDGHTYVGNYWDAGSEDTYPGREEWVSHHAGWAYLARWIKFQGAFSITDQAY